MKKRLAMLMGLGLLTALVVTVRQPTFRARWATLSFPNESFEPCDLEPVTQLDPKAEKRVGEPAFCSNHPMPDNVLGEADVMERTETLVVGPRGNVMVKAIKRGHKGTHFDLLYADGTDVHFD